jgi:hypothetical protein
MRRIQVSNTSPQYNASNTGAIFAQLNQKDVEEFYVGYQYWNLQHQIESLQIRLNDVRKQIIENTECMQEVQPTAIELATLARLQSNGVSDVDLLDRMLARGESWLDRTMQRLDYFEQLDDFISDDYTQWCQHALEGAYDWIDSVLDGNATSQPKTATTLATTEDVEEEERIQATEELFLQKISTDEDEAFMQEITMKRPSITITDLEEAVPTSEDIPFGVEVASTTENVTLLLEEENPVDTLEDTKTTNTGEDSHPEYNAFEEPPSVESSSTTKNGQTPLQESVEIPPVTQKSSTPQTNITPEHVSPKRPNFIKRFFGKIWGS